jgi:hypothetical protein
MKRATAALLAVIAFTTAVGQRLNLFAFDPLFLGGVFVG